MKNILLGLLISSLLIILYSNTIMVTGATIDLNIRNKLWEIGAVCYEFLLQSSAQTFMIMPISCIKVIWRLN